MQLHYLLVVVVVSHVSDVKVLSSAVAVIFCCKWTTQLFTWVVNKTIISEPNRVSF